MSILAPIFLIQLCLLLVTIITSRDVLELQGENFELALSSYKYVAILFYDGTEKGQSLQKQWQAAAEILKAPRDLYHDAEMAMVLTNSRLLLVVQFLN
jgi:hypothetical protein